MLAARGGSVGIMEEVVGRVRIAQVRVQAGTVRSPLWALAGFARPGSPGVHSSSSR